MEHSGSWGVALNTIAGVSHVVDIVELRYWPQLSSVVVMLHKA